MQLASAAIQTEPSFQLRNLVANIVRRRPQGMRAMQERAAEFNSELEMKLASIALNPAARTSADELLDDYWASEYEQRVIALDAMSGAFPEVIVGSGYHAAVYAATRVLSGHPRPLVIEQARVGGVYAAPGRAVYYLNSRNRRGGPGLPGDRGASLNLLPGAPLQPSHVSTAEYQTNDDMAFVIRLALAQYARVLIGEVTEFDGGTGVLSVSVRAGLGLPSVVAVPVSRVIDARGLGDPIKRDGVADGGAVLSFPQFMKQMAGLWPLRGVRRAAVVGAGDSARCAVEALLGLGPQPLMAAAELDTVDRIDLYGPGLPTTCDDWRELERSRYQAIGRYLIPDQFGLQRLKVYRTVGNCVALPGRGLVNNRSYDLVVDATGYRLPLVTGLEASSPFEVAGASVARVRTFGACRLFRVGPAANLAFNDAELQSGVAAFSANRVAMFRLRDKTAVLAATLPAAPPVKKEESAAPVFEKGGFITAPTIAPAGSLSTLQGFEFPGDRYPNPSRFFNLGT